MLRTGARVALSPPVLEELQDMLGDLHDSDITLEFLESSNSSDARVLYPQEAKIRKSLYNNFIKYVNSILSADNKVVRQPRGV